MDQGDQHAVSIIKELNDSAISVAPFSLILFWVSGILYFIGSELDVLGICIHDDNFNQITVKLRRLDLIIITVRVL